MKAHETTHTSQKTKALCYANSSMQTEACITNSLYISMILYAY